MKCLRMSALVSSLVALLFVGAAWGYPVSVGDTIKIYNSVGTTSGGEWIVKTPDGVELFRTFCVELDEYLSTGYPFIVDDISQTAVRGGVNTNEGDPLSNDTKWLFWHYTQGDLDDLVDGFTYGTDAGADGLQYAIWVLEGEMAATSNTNTLANQLIAAAGRNSAGFAEDVAVINLEYPNCCHDCYAQDLLVAGEPSIPPQEEPVPEPSTILLTGLGILGAAYWGRRRKV